MNQFNDESTINQIGQTRKCVVCLIFGRKWLNLSFVRGGEGGGGGDACAVVKKKGLPLTYTGSPLGHITSLAYL